MMPPKVNLPPICVLTLFFAPKYNNKTLLYVFFLKQLSLNEQNFTQETY
jgi:hypothetical protein